MKNADALRTLPSVEAILGDERVAPLLGRIPRRLVLMVVRKYLAEVRESLLAGKSSGLEWSVMLERLERQARPSLRRAINSRSIRLQSFLWRVEKPVLPFCCFVVTRGEELALLQAFSGEDHFDV